MPEKKVKIAFIEDAVRRNAAYRKRNKGLLKKAGELSTLCDVDVCVVIYNPYENQPEVWPNVQAAQRVISKFKRMPYLEQRKNMTDQESFTRKRILKVAEKVKKVREKNKEMEMEMEEVMYWCLTGCGGKNLSMEDLAHLEMLVDRYMKEASEMVEKLARGEGSSKMGELGSSNEVALMEEENHNEIFGLDATKKTQEFTENQNEHKLLQLVNGLEMLLPFGDDNNRGTSNALYLEGCGKTSF